MGETTPRLLRLGHLQDSLPPDQEDFEVVSEAVLMQDVVEADLGVEVASKIAVDSVEVGVVLATNLVTIPQGVASQLVTADHRQLLLRDQVVEAALAVVVVSMVPEDLTAAVLQVDMIDLAMTIGPADSEETTDPKVKDLIELEADLTWNRFVLATVHAIFHAVGHLEMVDTEIETVALVVIAHAMTIPESDPTKTTEMTQENYEDTSFQLDKVTSVVRDCFGQKV